MFVSCHLQSKLTEAKVPNSYSNEAYELIDPVNFEFRDRLIFENCGYSEIYGACFHKYILFDFYYIHIHLF